MSKSDIKYMHKLLMLSYQVPYIKTRKVQEHKGRALYRNGKGRLTIATYAKVPKRHNYELVVMNVDGTFTSQNNTSDVAYVNLFMPDDFWSTKDWQFVNNPENPIPDEEWEAAKEWARQQFMYVQELQEAYLKYYADVNKVNASERAIFTICSNSVHTKYSKSSLSVFKALTNEYVNALISMNPEADEEQVTGFLQGLTGYRYVCDCLLDLDLVAVSNGWSLLTIMAVQQGILISYVDGEDDE